MYQLDATTKSFQFKFLESDTTHSMWASAYSEITVSTDTLVSIASADGLSNGTTAVGVVPAPASGNSIVLKHFSLYNADNVTHTFEWQLNDSSTIRTVYLQVIPAGGSIICNGDGSWNVFDASGALVATSKPIPDTLVLRDSNANFQTNAVDQAVSTTITSAGTTTLTVASAPQQEFTGTAQQTVILPDATTLNTGHVFRIMNRTLMPGSVPEIIVKDNGGTILQAVTPSNDMSFTLIDNSSSNGVWDTSDVLVNEATWGAFTGCLVLRDENANFAANSVDQNLLGIVSSATPYTVTVGSSAQLEFTGTSNQTVVLPDVATLDYGRVFRIMNRSTGVVTVNNYSSVTVATVASGTDGLFTNVLGGSATGWDYVGYGVSGGYPKMCNYQYQYPVSTGGISQSSNPLNIPLNTKVSDISNLVSVNLSTGEITWNESGTFEIDVTLFCASLGTGTDSIAVGIYTGGGSLLEAGGIISGAGGINGECRLQTVRTVTSGDTWYVSAIIQNTGGGAIGTPTGSWYPTYPSGNAPGVIFEATQLA